MTTALVAEKECLGCSATKPLSCFSPQKGGLHERAARCKDCLALARRNRRACDPDLDRRNETRWRQTAGYVEKKKRTTAKRSANLDAARAAERRRHQRRDRVKTAQKEARRRARIRGSSIQRFSTEQLRSKVAMWKGCWLCDGPIEAIDHVKPLARGGSHCLANLRPACKSCNSWKRDRWNGPRWAMMLRRT